MISGLGINGMEWGIDDAERSFDRLTRNFDNGIYESKCHNAGNWIWSSNYQNVPKGGLMNLTPEQEKRLEALYNLLEDIRLTRLTPKEQKVWQDLELLLDDYESRHIEILRLRNSFEYHAGVQ